MSTHDGPEDPRIRAARYQDGLDVEALAALAGRDLSHGVGQTARERQQSAASDNCDAPAGDHAAQDDPLIPSRPGSEAMRLSSTVEAVARTAVERAIADGHFDHLAYAGKPLPDLAASTDPDWWTKSLMRREEVHATEGLGPEALLLRVVDAGLNDELDALGRETEVRETLANFNRRVIEARRQLLGGPPVITPTREVESEVLAWRERARERDRRAAVLERELESARGSTEPGRDGKSDPRDPRGPRGWLRRLRSAK
ncbi:DnaJ family domain-containing protein [Galactobacter caseinivorans]|nr:DnaJ family domain-containing protein [Galactobacter caseinivorans]